jgi:hypothetical protein
MGLRYFIRLANCYVSQTGYTSNFLEAAFFFRSLKSKRMFIYKLMEQAVTLIEPSAAQLL